MRFTPSDNGRTSLRHLASVSLVMFAAFALLFVVIVGIAAAVFFQFIELGVGVASLVVALSVGFYHLYRFITRQRAPTGPTPLEEYLTLVERLERARGRTSSTQENVRATVGMEHIFEEASSSATAEERRARYLLDVAIQHQTLTPLDQEELDRILPPILERVRIFVATHGARALGPSLIVMVKKAAIYIKVIRPELLRSRQ